AYDPSGREPQRASLSRFGVSGLPTQFVIDRDGRIAGRAMGLSPGGKTAMLEYYFSKAGLTVAPEIVEEGGTLATASETARAPAAGGTTRILSTPPAGATTQPAQRAGDAPAGAARGSTVVIQD